MRNTVFLAVLLLSGRASGSHVSESIPAEGLGKYKTVIVEVSTDDPENEEAIGQLKSAIVGKMAALSCFENYVTGADPRKADLKLQAKVTGVRHVSSAGRFFFGGFAGKARVYAEIQLIEVATGKTIGAFSIEGKSSGGSVVAGTTPQAFEKTGEGVAEYINAHK